ncbi:hypothetical protein DFH06DRAFT_587314 [Mycena polygramma]|nr:hypothetical protein DFH06DRAFT_587314 [Mycena polygramma]
MLKLMIIKVDEWFSRRKDSQGPDKITAEDWQMQQDRRRPRGPLDDSAKKRERALNKLKAIDELKLKQECGTVLEVAQVQKIGREAEIRGELAALRN